MDKENTGSQLSLFGGGGVFFETMAEDAGLGQEDISAKDVRLPRVKLAQSGTPEAKEGTGVTIEGVKEGVYFDSTLRIVYGSTVDIVPVRILHSYLEHTEDEQGEFKVVERYPGDTTDAGKFNFGDLPADPRKKGLYNPETGNSVMECQDIYGLVFQPESGQWLPGVFQVKSTALPVVRDLKTLIKLARIQKPDGGSFNPASFAFVYRFGSEGRSNKKNSWRVPTVEQIPHSESPHYTKETYAAAKLLYENFDLDRVNKATDADNAQYGPDKGSKPPDNPVSTRSAEDIAAEMLKKTK